MEPDINQAKEGLTQCIDHVQHLKDTWTFAAEDRGDCSFRAKNCETDLSKLLDKLSFIYYNIIYM